MDVTLRHHQDPERWLRLIARVGDSLAPGPELVWEPKDLDAAGARQLKSALLIGLLTGLKRCTHRNWSISIESLSGGPWSTPEDEAATVACALAIAQGSGQEDLRSQPHGGFAWLLCSLNDEPQ